jgi:hypothetical protein
VPTRKIIFVYNADSGFLNLYKNALHKWLSPATYPCMLCELTHGNFTEDRDWRIFHKSLPLPSEFLHKDEFKLRYIGHANEPLPAVYIDIDSAVFELVSQQRLNSLKNLRELERLITRQIAPFILPIHHEKLGALNNL